MPKTIHLTHDYAADPALVWEVATDIDALREAVKGLIVYDGLPRGRIFEGQTIKVRFSLFGRLPWQDYEMTLRECDETTRSFLSDEQGGGVRSWRHRLKVEETPTGARIVESIEIDAGMMTPVFAAWARFMYGRRHGPRAAILARRAKGDRT